MLIVS